MLETLNLSPFGALHTLISLIAVGAGIAELFAYKAISPKRPAGKIYVAGTVLSCLTGLFIFHHGGFGKGHILAIMTLFVLGIAITAGRTHFFGNLSRYVETVGYSMTFFFHMIPLVNETATRFPLGSPLAKDLEAPALQAAAAVLLVLFMIGAFLQVRRLRTTERGPVLDVMIPAEG